jgi:hypothetical protein
MLAKPRGDEVEGNERKADGEGGEEEYYVESFERLACKYRWHFEELRRRVEYCTVVIIYR